MSDYGRPIEFGLSVVPNAAEVGTARELAIRADALGLDLLGIQDHPYQWRYLETWMLMADLLARTERLRVFPDVGNLPLRLPALIAKQAASLDVLSGGRFELGLGTGAFWEAIGAMGGQVRSGSRRSRTRLRRSSPTCSGGSTRRPPRPDAVRVRSAGSTT